MNRTLVEAIRAMLADSKLLKSFWAEALSTATNQCNRSPTRTVQGMIPYEVGTGHKPNVSNLGIFGCNVHAHIPEDERGKVSSKTRRCTYFVYRETTRGFRLYDERKRGVFDSRDVVFNEAKTLITQRIDVQNAEEATNQPVVDISGETDDKW